MLDEKEREVLSMAAKADKTASSVVRELSRKRKWPRSSIWYVLKKLKMKGIIEWKEGRLRIRL